MRRRGPAVVGALVVIGVLQGVVWACVAPGVPYKVLADGRFGALPTTSTYYFVDVAIFALSGMVDRRRCWPSAPGSVRAAGAGRCWSRWSADRCSAR